MRQNSRLKHILAAGILTGLVFAIFIAFAWRDTSRATAPQPKAGLTMAAPEDTEALRTENERLRNAFATMRAREQTYQTQMEAANRTILQLQNIAANRPDDDHDEEEKHEEEEHERGEHKQEYEHGEDKDD